MGRSALAVAVGVGIQVVSYVGMVQLMLFLVNRHFLVEQTPTLMYDAWTTFMGPLGAAFVGGAVSSAVAPRRLEAHALASGAVLLAWTMAFRGHAWGLTPEPGGNVTLALILPAAFVGGLLGRGLRHVMGDLGAGDVGPEWAG